MKRRILIGMIAVMATGCSDPVSYRVDDLVGSWSASERVGSSFYRDLAYEFRADGTYTFTLKIYQVPKEAQTVEPRVRSVGSFTAEGDRLALVADSVITWDSGHADAQLGDGAATECTFQIKGGELTLVFMIDTGPSTTRLRRTS